MPPRHWMIKENVFSEAHKYSSVTEFGACNNTAYESARKNGWLEEMTFLAKCRYQKSGYWQVKDNVFAEAKKYKYKSDFCHHACSAYNSARANHWLEEMTWFKHKNIDRAPRGPVHSIYVYLDEENKYAYVGATNDIKRRDAEHRNTETDPVYKYFKSRHIDIPRCKIIVEGLTIVERQREERIQSLYYRDVLHYHMLNNVNLTGEGIGSIGSLATKWTKAKVIQEAQKYKTPTEFFTQSAGAYDAALRYKMMNQDTFPWFYSKRKPLKWWNVKEHIFEESKKYKTWNEFFWKSPVAYNAAKRTKCEHEITWLLRDQAPQNYWKNEEHVIEESRKYSTRTAFFKGCHAAYDYAYKNNLWNKMPWIKMDSVPHGYWTKERIMEEGKKYSTKIEFKRGNYTAYCKAVKFHWMDEMTWFVSLLKPRNYWQDKENVMTEGSKYTSSNPQPPS